MCPPRVRRIPRAISGLLVARGRPGRLTIVSRTPRGVRGEDQRRRAGREPFDPRRGLLGPWIRPPPAREQPLFVTAAALPGLLPVHTGGLLGCDYTPHAL